MYETLKPGLTFEFDFTVTESKTVPYIYPEFEEMRIMPKVFSTGYMIGVFEWDGYHIEIKKVEYEMQRGGNEMIMIKRP